MPAGQPEGQQGGGRAPSLSDSPRVAALVPVDGAAEGSRLSRTVSDSELISASSRPMQDGDHCQTKARTLTSLAGCGRMLAAFAACVPCVLLLLTYHGCVPSENSYRWSDHTLQRAKGYMEQIRWDLKHVQNLKTNMEYLRRSKEDEERRRCQEIPPGELFAYQETEVDRVSSHIDALKRELLNLPSDLNPIETAPAVLNTTVLTCDWLNRNHTLFDHTKGSEGQRGCHMRVEYGKASKALGVPLHRVDSDLESFGCFDADGEPQGCHRLVTMKVNRLRMKAGCASRNVMDWGWCGRFPGSHLVVRTPVDYDYYAAHGCTTVNDALADLWTWLVWLIKQFGPVLSALGLSSRLQRKALSEFQSYATERFDSVEETVDEMRAGHINRVSLSLNILEQSDGLPRLQLRTMWEKDLDTELITDKETRTQFMARAREAGQFEEDPFLMDQDYIGPFLRSLESGDEKPADRVGQVVNLFGNQISAACSSNFIVKDIRGRDSVQEIRYVFGITYEKPQRTEQSEHVQKVRVLLIREDSLWELEDMDSCDEVELQSDSDHHKMRFKHLQLLAKHWKWSQRWKKFKKEQQESRNSPELSRTTTMSPQAFKKTLEDDLKNKTASVPYVGSLQLCVESAQVSALRHYNLRKQ